jgi:hypothetical protein
MRSRVTNCSGLRPVVCLKTREKMERAQLDQLDQAGQGVDRDLFGQPGADVVFHLVEPADGQAAADLGALAGGVGVSFPSCTWEYTFAGSKVQLQAGGEWVPKCNFGTRGEKYRNADAREAKLPTGLFFIDD